MTTGNAGLQSIVVHAPAGAVYERWARFEDLPKFITPLRTVRKIDDTHFSFTWRPNGRAQHGVLQILLRIPQRRIAWQSTSNGFLSGVVLFESQTDSDTEITLKIRSAFDPPRLGERLREYLGNFKRMVENERAAS